MIKMSDEAKNEYSIRCCHCNAVISYTMEWCGEQIDCPNCQSVVLIPKLKKKGQPRWPLLVILGLLISAGFFLYPLRKANSVSVDSKQEAAPQTATESQKAAFQAPAPYDPYIPLETSGTDSHTNLIVQVHQMVKGWDVVKLGYAYEHEFYDARDHGKKLLWYDVTVQNTSLSSDLNVLPSHFHLIDSDRYSYPSETSKQQISSLIQEGLKTRGGLLFIVPENSDPLLLYYKPGIVLRFPVLERYGVGPEEVVVYISLIPANPKNKPSLTQ